MFALWAATRWDALLLVIAAQVLQMLRQLAPFVRFDGYHILADLTGVPDLYARIKPTLLGLLPTRWGSAESKVLKPWARVVVTIWVLTVVPLLLISLVLIVTALPRVAATAWRSLQHQAVLLGVNWADGDAARIGVGLLSILAISLPLLGTAYLLIRLVRQTVRSAWRATAGRRKHRMAAFAVAGALIAALAWAWWPDGTRYQPIQPHERGAVADAVPIASRQDTAPRVDRPLQVGQRRTVATVWPSTAPPPVEDQKRLALVMVPRHPAPSDSGTPAPAWVFPFNPPAAPGAGDNQALAVNTEDGSTLYDVAFALVWATDDTIDNSNAAYALASCHDCQTVAVAFQVVLVIGPADVVVPKNISAAVNYSCQDCLTYALASQLVVTLPGELSDDTKARLTALWEQIEEFGQNLQALTPQQIQAQLESYKAQILAIISADPAASPTPSQAPATVAPESSPAMTPTPNPTGTASATPLPTNSPTMPPTPAAPASPDGTPMQGTTPPDPTAEVTSPAPTNEPTSSAAPEQPPTP